MKLFAKLSTLFLAAALFLTGCGTSITGLTLDLPQTMERGSTLSATPEYAYSGDTPEAARAEELADKLELSWTSSDPSVVTVDGAGNLTAVSPGTAEVALSSGDGKLTASGVIRVVVSPTGLTLPQTLTLTEGGEPQSAAAVVEPADATDYMVNYRSSDDSIVTVDAAGTVTPVAAGEALVTAEIPGKGLAATCHVVVKPALKALHLSEDALTLSTGKTESLTLTAEPEEAELAGVVWTSSDEAVATVDGDGTVTAVAEGKATVTASVDGVEASCAVTVRAPAPAAGSGSGSGSGGSSAPAASTSYERRRRVADVVGHRLHRRCVLGDAQQHQRLPGGGGGRAPEHRHGAHRHRGPALLRHGGGGRHEPRRLPDPRDHRPELEFRPVCGGCLGRKPRTLRRHDRPVLHGVRHRLLV